MSQPYSDTKPNIIVIFGASGDLTHRKLIPALYNNYKKGRLLEETRIVGFARRPWSERAAAEPTERGFKGDDPVLHGSQKVRGASSGRIVKVHYDLDIADLFSHAAGHTSYLPRIGHTSRVAQIQLYTAHIRQSTADI